jgi:peroxiredoxin/outer membrane lipoprotein-sorting protein
MSLLKQVADTYRAMHTLSADFAVHQNIPGMGVVAATGTVKAEKPNRYVIDCSGMPPMRMVSDGKTALFVVKPNLAYSVMPASGQSMNLSVTAVAPLTLFFNQKKLLAPDTLTKYFGTEVWESATCDVVEQTVGRTTMRFYITPGHLVTRIKVHLEMGGQRQDVDAVMRHIRVNAPVTAADLDTTPPQGARPFEMPLPGGKPLQVGEQAPDFTLPRPGQGRIVLSDVLKGRKATIVTFWFYECATCREELPMLQRLYTEMQPKGLEIVAVNSNNDSDVVLPYLQKLHATFAVGLDDDGAHHYGVAKQYGVSLYPTTYVLDANGKIAARLVACKEAELRSVLAKLGIQ